MDELERKLRQARDEMPSRIELAIHRGHMRLHGEFRMIRSEQATEDEYPYRYEPIGGKHE